MSSILDSPADRAWKKIAAEVTAAHPGWLVTYGWFGFTATSTSGDGQVLGPAGRDGIAALIESVTADRRAR